MRYGTTLLLILSLPYYHHPVSGFSGQPSLLRYKNSINAAVSGLRYKKAILSPSDTESKRRGNVHSYHRSHSDLLRQWMSNENSNNFQPTPSTDPIVKQTSLNLRRVSWLSWWAQVILTVISSVIFIFARSVFHNVGVSPWQPSHGNFVLAASGIIMSFLSIFWTWGGGARLSRRLVRLPTTREQAANMLRRAVRVGVSLNLIGMFIILIGMEQTVGTLAVKVLTVRPWSMGAGMGVDSASVWAGVQPLDILVVQANTNSMLSHFCSLCAFLYLTKHIEKLDPPTSGMNTSTTPPAAAR